MTVKNTNCLFYDFKSITYPKSMFTVHKSGRKQLALLLFWSIIS
ncbi:hypothetical protein RCH19_002651 [Flavobacterium sp. PL12]